MTPEQAIEEAANVVIGTPQDAARFVRAAAVLLETEPELVEAIWPRCWMTGWQTELLRCALAIGAGQEPPPPLDWLPARKR